MEGFVQVKSREMIKPSSQTLLHHKKLKLSYIDRLFSPLYVPLIFYYKADESSGLTASNHLQISQQLKHCLLQALVSFYPLAGRLKSNTLVECNDEGVEFVEARVHAHLEDSLYMDDQLKHFLPSSCTKYHSGKRPRPVLVVQITFFDCGGLVVGAGFSHAITDLASAMVFLHSWAAAFKGEVRIDRHNFGTTTCFPTLRIVPFSKFVRFFKPNEKFTTKKLVFNKEKLDILRKAATSTSESCVKDPSRIEVVSSFIWKHFMLARLQKGEAKKIYPAFHAVNLRPRTNPPRLLENVFGNCIMLAMAFPGSNNNLHLHELIGRLRSSIRRVRGDYITKPLNKESYMKDMLKLGFLLMIGKVEWCFFTSWRGFPTYELDYGWGKPVWFTTPSMPCKNLIVLVSSKSGDDLEAIVIMKPQDIQFLDAQINLISTNI